MGMGWGSPMMMGWGGEKDGGGKQTLI